MRHPVPGTECTRHKYLYKVPCCLNVCNLGKWGKDRNIRTLTVGCARIIPLISNPSSSHFCLQGWCQLSRYAAFSSCLLLHSLFTECPPPNTIPFSTCRLLPPYDSTALETQRAVLAYCVAPGPVISQTPARNSHGNSESAILEERGDCSRETQPEPARLANPPGDQTRPPPVAILCSRLGPSSPAVAAHSTAALRIESRSLGLHIGAQPNERRCSCRCCYGVVREDRFGELCPGLVPIQPHQYTVLITSKLPRVTSRPIFWGTPSPQVPPITHGRLHCTAGHCLLPLVPTVFLRSKIGLVSPSSF